MPFSYNDDKAIARALDRAGFSGISIEALRLHAPLLSPERFANGLVFGNPVHEEIASRGGDAEAVCEALARAIAETLGETLELNALVVSAASPERR